MSVTTVYTRPADLRTKVRSGEASAARRASVATPPKRMSGPSSIARFYDRRADLRPAEQRRQYNVLLRRYYQYHIPAGRRVLEIGCGVGDLLAAVRPGFGVGLDGSARCIALARERHPGLCFEMADIEQRPEVIWPQPMQSGSPINRSASVAPVRTFDYLILSDLVNDLRDVQAVLERLRAWAGARTRLILNFHNNVWRPVLEAAEKLEWKAATPPQNWLSSTDTRNLLHLAGWELISQTSRILCPVNIPVVAPLLNRFGAPFLTPFCWTIFQVARPAPEGGTFHRHV